MESLNSDKCYHEADDKIYYLTYVHHTFYSGELSRQYLLGQFQMFTVEILLLRFNFPNYFGTHVFTRFYAIWHFTSPLYTFTHQLG